MMRAVGEKVMMLWAAWYEGFENRESMQASGTTCSLGHEF